MSLSTGAHSFQRNHKEKGTGIYNPTTKLPYVSRESTKKKSIPPFLGEKHRAKIHSN
jgi:hypothetical protein